MKVRNIGSHMTEVEKTIHLFDEPIKYNFLVSYETPVAVRVEDDDDGVRALITDRKYSMTTSRHITKWLDYIELPSGISEVESVPQEEIDRLFDL